MKTKYSFLSIKEAYNILRLTFPGYPEPEKRLENFFAVQQKIKDNIIFRKLNHKLILFNKNDKRLGTVFFNIETNLTLDSDSNEIQEAVTKLYSLHYKKLSMIIYQQLLEYENNGNQDLLSEILGSFPK